MAWIQVHGGMPANKGKRPEFRLIIYNTLPRIDGSCAINPFPRWWVESLVSRPTSEQLRKKDPGRRPRCFLFFAEESSWGKLGNLGEKFCLLLFFSREGPSLFFRKKNPLCCVFFGVFVVGLFFVPSGKLTWQWKIPIFNREYIFNRSIFHGYVSLPEGIFFGKFEVCREMFKFIVAATFSVERDSAGESIFWNAGGFATKKRWCTRQLKHIRNHIRNGEMVVATSKIFHFKPRQKGEDESNLMSIFCQMGWFNHQPGNGKCELHSVQ